MKPKPTPKNRFAQAPAWLVGGLSILLICWCGSCPLRATVASGRPRPEDITLRLTLLAEDGQIGAHEPLVARVAIRNRSGHPVEFPVGSWWTTHIEVREATRGVVAASPQPEIPADLLHAGWRLAAGETKTMLLIITGLYQFREPGEYTVLAQQLELSPQFPVLAEDRGRVKVLPFDSSRLERRCEELFGALRKGTSDRTDLPMGARTKALYSVGHDAVLPYLDWMARTWQDRYAVRSMLRIGTERAMKLVNALAARKDRAGEAARQALKMRLEPSFWDIEGD